MSGPLKRRERERDLIEESCNEEGSRREKQREEKEREKGVSRREREAQSNKLWSYQVELTIFNIFTKMPLSNVI